MFLRLKLVVDGAQFRLFVRSLKFTEIRSVALAVIRRSIRSALLWKIILSLGVGVMVLIIAVNCQMVPVSVVLKV